MNWRFPMLGTLAALLFQSLETAASAAEPPQARGLEIGYVPIVVRQATP
ncbi:MAG: hypothetical protein NTY53_26390 [Kiritimatiellaeota bacterium]|nr:hypothetical protein [Kiritimatiellota bacterium]